MSERVRRPDGGGQRVVITGIGLVTPLGADRESSWRAIRAGRRAVDWLSWPNTPFEDGPQSSPVGHRPLPRDLQIGAPAQLDSSSAAPTEASVPGRTPDRISCLALRAAGEAFEDAGLASSTHSSAAARSDRSRWGCVVGTSKPGLRSFQRLRACGEADEADAGWLWSQFQPATPASLVASRFGLQAAALCPVAACATGLVCLLRGAQLIREQRCDLVLAGSTDASLQLGLLGSFHRLGVLARQFEEPAAACRPFDARRDGFAVGEGAAVFVLERLTHAQQRGARPYAEWLGGSMASDVTSLTQLDTTGAVLTHVLRETLRTSGLAAQEVDYVNLHGTATRDNDLCETRALRTVFGEHADTLATSSQKGALGHLLGAAGSVELACSTLALRDGFVPPTMNLEQCGAECDLDYTPQRGRPRSLHTVLKVSLGFGGHVAVGSLRRLSPSRAPGAGSAEAR